MKTMKLVENSKVVEQRGSFGEPFFSEFWVSTKIFQFAQKYGISDAFDLMSWVSIFSQGVASELGWTHEEVTEAFSKMHSEIGVRGKWNEGMNFDLPTIEFHTTGALPPDDLLGKTAAEIVKGGDMQSKKEAIDITAEEARALNDEYIFSQKLNFANIKERIIADAKKGKTQIVVSLLDIDLASRDRAFLFLKEACEKNRFVIKRTQDSGYSDPREPFNGSPSDFATISW